MQAGPDFTDVPGGGPERGVQAHLSHPSSTHLTSVDSVLINTQNCCATLSFKAF